MAKHESPETVPTPEVTRPESLDPGLRAAGNPGCVLCHQPAELEFEGVPVCKDCFSLQGSICSGPLYRMIQEKRKKDRELPALDTSLPGPDPT